MDSARKKIAVIGTGAAGFGVLTALLRKKSDFDIVIFDIGKDVSQASLPDSPSADEVSTYYDQVYKEINSKQPRKFPPPKTHLAKQIPRQPVGQDISIFKSESFGGLTNYWGSTMLPFTKRELAKWPISREDLNPYYKLIADTVGLSAESSALDEYFEENFAVLPPIKPIDELILLNEAINENKKSKKFKIISGINHCGVETRPDLKRSCVYCGECLAGCFKDAIFSARQKINEYLSDSRIKETRRVAVKKIKKQDQFWEIETIDGKKEAGFTQVFLAAGCPASTEIVLRSFDISDNLVMADNAVYVFPIIYFGRKISSADHSYVSLCNLILGCVPNNSSDQLAQAQIYPNFDYMWRYNIPNFLWPLLKPVVTWFRSHIFWARLYVHSDYSQSYSVRLEDDKLKMEKHKKANYNNQLKILMADLRRAISGKKFYLPPVKPILQKVNSHYTSTLPFGNEILNVSVDGEVAPGLYLCDSSIFPAAPAINPGFTIMANACRIADKAID